MKKLCASIFICSVLFFSCTSPKPEDATASKATSDSAAAAARGYDFGDPKYVDLAKKHMAYLESGDIDGWMTQFADNAVYRWNNFDSLVGKAAITDYWKKRRTDAIDSMSFTSDIWLPINVIKSQAPGHLTGNYALSWYIVSVKYKTGKSMRQRIHTAIHFDANDKIDRLTQYLDRAPIIAATTK